MKTIRLMTFLSGLLFATTNITQAQTVTLYPLSAELFYAPKLPQVDMNYAKTELARILKRILVLADYLFYFQSHLNIQTIQQRYDSLIILFKPIAAQYCTLKVKPPVSEEQRKYIVQANMFNQEKSYGKAIDIYKKVVELDQTAYPAAYSNLALLFAQLDKFSDAIFYMKKYLLLEPESTDARSAQDKIYEWEAQITK